MDFVNHNEQGKQVQFIDSRFYTKDEKTYFPGVTTILGVIDKGTQYKKWLQSNGFNADILARQAMDQGSNVHQAIQDFLNGYEICWHDDKNRIYTKNEWIMVGRFIDFFTEFKPEIVAVEKVLVSEKLGYGTQLDFVCRLNGELWYVDHKTGSYYEDSHLQLAASMKLWNEYYPDEQIKKCGILHLESAHRGRDKSGKSIQGIGWKLWPVENIEKEWQDFQAVYQIWKRKNPNFRPFNLVMPDRYSLKEFEK